MSLFSVEFVGQRRKEKRWLKKRAKSGKPWTEKCAANIINSGVRVSTLTLPSTRYERFRVIGNTTHVMSYVPFKGEFPKSKKIHFVGFPICWFGLNSRAAKYSNAIKQNKISKFLSPSDDVGRNHIFFVLWSTWNRKILVIAPHTTRHMQSIKQLLTRFYNVIFKHNVF